MNNLGFGTMRLPLKSADPADFDYDQLNLMVDTFLAAGFTYFDTSFLLRPPYLFVRVIPWSFRRGAPRVRPERRAGDGRG